MKLTHLDIVRLLLTGIAENDFRLIKLAWQHLERTHQFESVTAEERSIARKMLELIADE